MIPAANSIPDLIPLVLFFNPMNTIRIVTVLTIGCISSYIIYKISKLDSNRNSAGSYSEESQSLLEILYKLSQETAKKEGIVHRSITCNHCSISPIRGIRFKCSNCVDFDLCEQCENLCVHDPLHLVLKIRVPVAPLSNPRSSLLPLFYPGTIV